MARVWKSRLENQITTPPTKMPELIWKWLASRGLTESQAIDQFLSPSLAGLTHPSKLRGMDQAVTRLVQAFQNDESICIYGDYDLDGSSGIALLISGLKLLGFRNLSFYQPRRFVEGYGIHKDALQTIADRGDRVVVSVDCGITAIEESAFARELGLDLIITDHHLPALSEDKEELIPQCVAVINPNQKDCTSGLGHLSGVGVGFYLLLGLKTALKIQCDLKECLDLFAIGTVTDMVPLKAENRVLVKHGLKRLSQTQRPGLQALLKRLGLWGKELDSMDLAFTFAPKLNALSRLEQGVRPLEVMMCADEQASAVIAEEVIRLNDERKALQQALEKSILEQIENETDEPAIVLAAKGHAGVVGLIATKVFQLTGKPAYIVAWHGEGSGIGSARGRESDQLPRALAAAGPHLERFGGHAQAAGFSLRLENFSAFKADLLGHHREVNTKGTTEDAVVYDSDAKLTEFTENFMTWLKHAGPFGADNPNPVFKISNPAVGTIRWLKDQHLKLTLNEGRLQIEALAFFAKGRFSIEKGENIELLVEPSWNHFRGEKHLQLLIRDLRQI